MCHWQSSMRRRKPFTICVHTVAKFPFCGLGIHNSRLNNRQCGKVPLYLRCENRIWNNTFNHSSNLSHLTLYTPQGHDYTSCLVVINHLVTRLTMTDQLCNDSNPCEASVIRIRFIGLVRKVQIHLVIRFWTIQGNTQLMPATN